ncbi:beta-eliminating lyase-related protein [Geminicoccaceae bacterium 1502E]|nr:beta-eliminating lyase-related protein [Geminicoccaceae bacterium 1502E]
MSGSTVDFRSDNTGAAAPEILAALAAANHGTAAGYGGDPLTERLQERMGELFEHKVHVFPVATGTAANALALAGVTPSWGSIYCSREAHIETSECNAAGFMSGGAKLHLVAGEHGRIDPAALEEALENAGKGQAHRSQPAALNIVQATDRGAVYRLDEVRELGAIARLHGLHMHMDGARFANALAHLRCSPAELTWKAGVDILSFGATKNGGLTADAIVVFKEDLVEPLRYQIRRAGHVLSKMRFASAQLLAAIEGGLWLRLAGRANEAAARLATGIEALPGLRLAAPVEVNMLFVEAAPEVLDGLEAEEILFFRRRRDLARFVCRWDVAEEEVEALLAALRRQIARRAA